MSETQGLGQAEKIAYADFLQHFHRQDVVGTRQRRPEAGRTVPPAVVVHGRVRFPLTVVESRGQVKEDGGRGVRSAVGGVESSGVGDRLQGRARLAEAQHGVDRSGVLPIEIVRAPDPRQHVAGAGVQRQQCSAVHFPGQGRGGRTLHLPDATPHHLFRFFLQSQVQGGVDPQATFTHSLHPQFSLQNLLYQEDEMRGFDRESLPGEPQRLFHSFLRIISGYKTSFYHTGKHIFLPCFRRGKVGRGVVPGWILGKTGQESTLGQVQVSDVLPEIRMGCSSNAHGKISVVEIVQVSSEYLVLGVLPLQLEGKPDFSDFPSQAPLAPFFRRHVEESHSLLRDSAGTADRMPCPEILPRSPCNRRQIYARMAVEMHVLGSYGGLTASIGDLAQGDRAYFLAVRVYRLIEQPTISIENQVAG